MKHLVIAFIVAAGLVAPAGAQTPSASGAAAEKAWARATPGGAKTGAIYLTLVNHGSDGDRLLGVATPVAEHAQLHQESVENGIMKMRPVTDVEVKPGASLALKPGGTHIMLTGLTQSLKEGDTFPLTLDFAKAGKQEVEVKVARTGAVGMDTMGSHDMGHMEMMQH